MIRYWLVEVDDDKLPQDGSDVVTQVVFDKATVTVKELSSHVAIPLLAKEELHL